MKRHNQNRGGQPAGSKSLLAITAVALLTSLPLAAVEQVLAFESPAVTECLKVRLSWGHQSGTVRPFRIGFGTNHVVVTQVTPDGFESGDVQKGGVYETHAGAGDVDAVIAEVSWKKPTQPALKLGPIWDYLFQHSTPEAAARLQDDSCLTPDAPVLTVQLAEDGTRGFSIGLEQLQRHKAMWLPEQNVFVTLADAPVDFAAHVASLTGERVLDRVKHEPEATLADFTSRWEDMGDANVYHSPWAQEWLGERGHVIPTARARLTVQIRDLSERRRPPGPCVAAQVWLRRELVRRDMERAAAHRWPARRRHKLHVRGPAPRARAIRGAAHVPGCSRAASNRWSATQRL